MGDGVESVEPKLVGAEAHHRIRRIVQDPGQAHRAMVFYVKAESRPDADGGAGGKDDEVVVIVGLGPRFQIWDRARWNARRDARRALARQVMNGEGG